MGPSINHTSPDPTLNHTSPDPTLVGVGVHPQIADGDKQKPQQAQQSAPADYEGCTVHEAIVLESGFNDFSITKIEGKFNHPDPADPKTVQAGVHETTDRKKYFKFDVEWRATVKDTTTNEEKTVQFSQTVYTNVEIPESTSIREFEKAKEHAYGIAKSFELLQHNLVKLDNLPDNYETQIKALKESNTILFKKMEENSEAPPNTLMEEHRAVNLQPRTLSGISLSYFSNRVSEVGQNAILNHSYERKNIVLDPKASTLLSRFEAKEKGKDITLKTAEQKQYSAFLKEKSDLYNEAFINQKKEADAELRKVESASRSKDAHQLKEDYLKLKNQTLKKPDIVGSRPPNVAEEKLKNERRAQLEHLEKDIFEKAGIPKLEARLAEMQKLQTDYISIYKHLESIDSFAINQMASKAKLLDQDLEALKKKIENAKEDLLAAPKPPLVERNEEGAEAPNPATDPADITAKSAVAVKPATNPADNIQIVLEEVDDKANEGKAKSLLSTFRDFFSWVASLSTATQAVEFSTYQQPERNEQEIKSELKAARMANNVDEAITQAVDRLTLEEAEKKLKEHLLNEIIRNPGVKMEEPDGNNIIKNYSLEALRYVKNNLPTNQGDEKIDLKIWIDQEKENLKDLLSRKLGDKKPPNFDSMNFNHLVHLLDTPFNL